MNMKKIYVLFMIIFTVSTYSASPYFDIKLSDFETLVKCEKSFGTIKFNFLFEGKNKRIVVAATDGSDRGNLLKDLNWQEAKDDFNFIVTGVEDIGFTKNLYGLILETKEGAKPILQVLNQYNGEWQKIVDIGCQLN